MRDVSRTIAARPTAATATAAIRPRSPTSAPSSPSRSPLVAPAAVAAAKNRIIVVRHFTLRLRSPSGVMLPSIEIPQGDHAASAAPITARRTAPAIASDRLVCIGPAHGFAERPLVEAGVIGPDAGILERGVFLLDARGAGAGRRARDLDLFDLVTNERDHLFP